MHQHQMHGAAALLAVDSEIDINDTMSADPYGLENILLFTIYITNMQNTVKVFEVCTIK